MLPKHLVGALFGATIVATPLIHAQDMDLTGAPTNESTEPFTSFTGIAEVAPGIVITSDLREKRFVRMDLNTGEIRNIGREGGGPGEWQFPTAVFAGKGKNAYVADMMQAKLHIVSPEGKIIRSVPLVGSNSQQSGPMSLVMPAGVDAKGRLYYNALSFGPDMEASDTSPVVRRDFTDPSSKIDTVGWIPNQMTIQIASTTSSASSGTFAVRGGPKPFEGRDAWVALPNGAVAVISPDPYRMTLHSMGNPPVSGPIVDYTPVKINDTERQAYRDRQKAGGSMATMISVGGSSGGVSSTTMDLGGGREIPDGDFPEVMPPFSRGNSVEVTTKGNIWVLRNRASTDPNPTYDIFSSGGRKIGTARLRPNSRVVGFGDGAVYVQRQDPADDFLYLERYLLN